MGTFIASFLIISLAVGGMAIGVLFGRRPIAGSCGGLNALEGGEGQCSSCSRPCSSRLVRRRAGPMHSGEDDWESRRVPPEHMINTIRHEQES